MASLLASLLELLLSPSEAGIIGGLPGTPNIYMGPRYPNSSLQACLANVLKPEPSPQLLKCFNILNISTALIHLYHATNSLHSHGFWNLDADIFVDLGEGVAGLSTTVVYSILYSAASNQRTAHCCMHSVGGPRT